MNPSALKDERSCWRDGRVKSFMKISLEEEWKGYLKTNVPFKTLLISNLRKNGDREKISAITFMQI